VNRYIQEAAEDDIVRQFEWYLERGVPDVARRFRAAVFEAIDQLVVMPDGGPPLTNPLIFV
jgi:plasmid stabilization system protein ParE